MAGEEEAATTFNVEFSADGLAEEAPPPPPPPSSPSQFVVTPSPPPPRPPSPYKAAAAAVPRRPAAAAATAADDTIDYAFLDSLANKRKVRKKRDHAGTMGAHDDLRMYDDENEEQEERNQIERLHRLRQEAESEHLEEDEPLAVADEHNGRNIDNATFAEIMGGKSAKTARVRSSNGSTASLRNHQKRGDLQRDPFVRQSADEPRKSAAQLYIEERQHKTKRISRIMQLEAKGIESSLPEGVDPMSLPLSQIDDACMLMEVIYKRKGKILKMRAGFFALNKALVWGATSHPGPEFLKFYKVRGFDKVIAEEIDEFDDDLEKIYDSWFGESGEMHPVVSILLLEATMLGNHIMHQSGDSGVKTTVDGVRSDGAPRGQSQMASQGNLLTNLMSMISNNPAMAPAVSNMVAAASTSPPPQSQPSPPPQHIFQVRDYGQPPTAFDPSISKELQERDRQIQNLEARLKVEAEKKKQQQDATAVVSTDPDDDTDLLRVLMDDLMEEKSPEPEMMNKVDEEEADAPLTVEINEEDVISSRGKGGGRRRRT